jgi:hypothetical protein
MVGIGLVEGVFSLLCSLLKTPTTLTKTPTQDSERQPSDYRIPQTQVAGASDNSELGAVTSEGILYRDSEERFWTQGKLVRRRERSVVVYSP